MISETKKKLQKIFLRIEKLALKGKDYIWEYFKLIDELINRGDFDNFTQTLYYYYAIDIRIYNGNLNDIKNKTWPEILLQTNSSLQRQIKKLFDSKEVYQQGYNIWSDSVTTVGFNISNPLSTTYSVTSSTQSVTPSRQGNYIYFTVNSPEIYNMKLYKCEWKIQNGVEQPFLKTLELFQDFKMYATQSTYLTQLSIYTGGQYLITTQARNLNLQFTQLNYKLVVTRNSLLGQIIEFEDYNSSPGYYLEDIAIANFYGFRKTYLEVVKTGTASIFVTYTNPELNEEKNLLKRYQVAIDYLLNL